MRLQIAEETFHTVEPTGGFRRMRAVTFQRCTELFEQFALTTTEIDRSFHSDTAHQVASTAATYRSNALATQAELLAGLRTFGNLQLDPTIQRRHFQLAAHCSIGKADRHFALQ